MIKQLTLASFIAFTALSAIANDPAPVAEKAVIAKTATAKISAQIIGSWKFDADAMIANMEKQFGRKFPAEQVPKFKEKIAQMTIVISENKFTAKNSSVGKEQVVNYKILSETADSLNIEITAPTGQTEKSVFTIKNGQIHMSSKDGNMILIKA